MSYNELAPLREPHEPPEVYLERILDYLTRPHRRRLGKGTAGTCRKALEELTRAAHP